MRFTYKTERIFKNRRVMTEIWIPEVCALKTCFGLLVKKTPRHCNRNLHITQSEYRGESRKVIYGTNALVEKKLVLTFGFYS
jgi:hypothetical protein